MISAGKYKGLCGCFLFLAASVFGQETNDLPPLSLLRAEEDYSSLGRGEGENFLESVKYLSLGKRSYFSFGGEARYLGEFFHNNGWDQASGSNGWLLQRYMLHSDFHLANFRIFAQLSSTWQNFTGLEPRGVDEDRLDFHQVFIQYEIPVASEGKIVARLGRQEFWLGSRRLVSVREGPNVRLSFDAARLYFIRPGLRLDAIYAGLVGNEKGVFDNENRGEEKFWGLYGVAKEVAGPFNMDLYYLGFHSKIRVYDEGREVEERHSLGVRIWKNGKMNVNGELIYQFGSFGSGVINAYTASIDLSFKTELPGEPVFGVKSEIISGDKTNGDGDLQTFNALYPRGAYFGLIALIGPANLVDIHPSISFAMAEGLSFTADWDVFWRHRKTDGIYGPNNLLERSGIESSESYIGHQPGFEIAFEPGRYWSFSLEGSYFLAGRFFEETGTGSNVLHFAASTRFKF